VEGFGVSDRMTASDVRAGLRRRWPEGEYLHIEEAPDDAMRQGRKLDQLVVSLWRSRGYELDGIEVKVSLADWRRELKDPGKADWWWAHVHRFWLAAPLDLASTIRAELPSTWGLLGVSQEKTLEVVKAPRHDATRLPWQTVIGLMRAASSSGWAALQRAEERGRDEGYKRAKREIEHQTGDAGLRRQLEDLRAKTEAFAEASGIDIAETYGLEDAARVGEIVGSARRWLRDPKLAGVQLRRQGAQAQEIASRLEELAEALERGLGSGPPPRERREVVA
jgi:hypothetical protein